MELCNPLAAEPHACVQAAEQAAAEEAREAGLEGKDAFAELKKLSANGTALHGHDPREDLERLYRRAPLALSVLVCTFKTLLHKSSTLHSVANHSPCGHVCQHTETRSLT